MYVDSTYQNSSNDAKYTPVAEGTNIFYSDRGLFTVTGVKFTGTPGSKYKVVFQTDGIDQTKPSNKEYLAAPEILDANFNLNISLRECAVGEKFSDKGR